MKILKQLVILSFITFVKPLHGQKIVNRDSIDFNFPDFTDKSKIFTQQVKKEVVLIKYPDPMTIFSTWNDKDTIRIMWESGGCKYYGETLELTQFQNIYVAKIFDKKDSLIIGKVLNLSEMALLKEYLIKILIEKRGEACLQDYVVLFSLNDKIYSKSKEEYDCRMNSFWEIKDYMTNVETLKPYIPKIFRN